MFGFVAPVVLMGRSVDFCRSIQRAATIHPDDGPGGTRDCADESDGISATDTQWFRRTSELERSPGPFGRGGAERSRL
jgi:hypothetical protein